MSDERHYDDTPHAEEQKAGKSRALATFEAFEGEMRAKEMEYISMLPSTLSKERFINTAISAVKQNPDLLNCTPRTLFQSITRAALDGLLPDGREGVITAYNVKCKGKIGGVWKEWYEKQAQWNPMAYGLRKRVRELDRIIVDAQEVYENDFFDREQGDEPRIVHKPAALNVARGDMIGAYAIFKREDGTILHREVMNKEQIETVRAQSKAPDSLMWTKFASEGYKKTVLRRGIKSVPVSDNMAEIIQRDDEANFEFNQDHAPAPVLTPPPAPPAPPALEHKEQIPVPTAPPKAPEPVADAPKPRGRGKKKADVPAPEPEPEPASAPAETDLVGDWSVYLDRQFEEFDGLPPALAEGVSAAVEDAVQAALERGEVSREQSEAILEKWREKIA